MPTSQLKIAATGLDGLVGSRIHELLKNDFQFIPLSKTKVDITKKEPISKALQTIDFDIMLHLAAYTNVDLAENQPDIAWKVNVEGTRHIFESIKQLKKKIVFISTDFVFDGENPPFFEDSPPNPLSVYGKTKLEAEKIIGNEGMIVRISYPYRAQFQAKMDLVRSIFQTLQKKGPIQAVTDQIITPTFIDDIAYSLRHLLHNFDHGIFHVVGQNSLSAYDLVLTIGEIFGLDTTNLQKTTHDVFYRNRAPRPKKGIIKSRKNPFFPMKTFKEGLEEVKRQLKTDQIG